MTAGPLQKTLNNLQRTVDQRETAKVYQLPIWPDPARGVPNELIRSALFAAIQAQGRDYIDNTEIACQDGYSIVFTGQRLDQSHLDVFEGVMHIARGVHEGNRICFSAHKLLRLIGRNTGRSDHVWLHRTLKHLTATAVEIRDLQSKRLFWGSLLPRGAADEDSAQYVIEVNRDLVKLFDRGFTQIDWEQRRLLRRKPLAQWLHLYYSSHAKPHPVSVAWLRNKSGSKTASLRAFRQKLKAALNEIQSAGVVVSWEIIDDLVHVVRVPTPSQQRYIARQGQQ
jgi:TrfA protein